MKKMLLLVTTGLASVLVATLSGAQSTHASTAVTSAPLTESSPTPSTISPPAPAAKAVPLDHAVKPNQSDDNIPGVFKDMVVVQRKAKVKARKFLFSVSGNIDFSDGPITNYALNTDIGYAISDFWEIYLNIVPYFLTVQRPIVGKVVAVDPSIDFNYASPTTQFGLNLLWLPAYGKESWGPYRIVRSDTFFKFNIAEVNYQGYGNPGVRVSALAGKTYYVANWFNIRAAAGLAYVQTVVFGAAGYNLVPDLELGLVWYF